MFPATAFINILMATIGMLLASISFSFLIYTLVNRSQFGNIIALVWMVASVILYPIVETEVTPNGMAGFGWNFAMACFRSYTLMETGVSAFVPGYNLSVAILWLYIDAVIYLLLAWYAFNNSSQTVDSMLHSCDFTGIWTRYFPENLASSTLLFFHS